MTLFVQALRSPPSIVLLVKQVHGIADGRVPNCSMLSRLPMHKGLPGIVIKFHGKDYPRNRHIWTYESWSL